MFTLSPPLVIMLLLPTAVYDDDDESAAVVSVVGGKVIEEFESIGMVYDVQLFHRMGLHCSRRTQPSSLWKAMRRSR